MLERTLVLATRNHGKITEFRELLAGHGIEIKSLRDFGPIPDVVEDGKTFEDNAYKKAYSIARFLGLPALADDSGLVVKALGGAPGVYSARYAGEDATDEENNLKLLQEMEGKTDREAYFESVIIVAVPRGVALTYVGRCYGEIALEPAGQKGFGYDPLFYYPSLKKTFAQMSLKEKNSVSHRGKAMAELGTEFDKVMVWLSRMMEERHF